MAASLLTQYQAVIDNPGTFIKKVTVSISLTAQAIGTEATNTLNHTNRVALAKAVASNPPGYAQAFAFMLAAQGIDDSGADSVINSMVSSVWNTVAGAL